MRMRVDADPTSRRDVKTGGHLTAALKGPARDATNPQAR
jgi:hypothetical protein